MTTISADELDRAKQATGAGPRRLSNYPPVSQTTIHGKAALLFSLPFLLVGTWILLISVGVVAVEPSTIHAPMWVIGVAGGVFFLAGLSLFLHALIGIRREARLTQQAIAHPDQPWLADYAWCSEGIRSRQGSSFLTQALGTSVALGLLAVLNWVAFRGDTPGLFALAAGLFDLIFVFVFVRLLRGAIARVKFGRPMVQFSEFPARPGQALHLRVTSANDLPRAQSLSASLRFVEERYETHGSGKNRTQTVACFEHFVERQELQPEDARKLSIGGLELAFRLPTEAPSTQLRSRPARYWDLELSAEVPGVDFNHRFLIPVYGEALTRPAKLAA